MPNCEWTFPSKSSQTMPPSGTAALTEMEIDWLSSSTIPSPSRYLMMTSYRTTICTVKVLALKANLSTTFCSQNYATDGLSPHPHYTSPSSGEAYRVRQLTTSFELKFFVCRHVSMWGLQSRVCLSVRPSVRLSVRLSVCPSVRTPRKEITLAFVNMSPTLVIDTSMERSLWILHHGNPKILICFQKSSKFEFWLVTKTWSHLSFVNISPTFEIDTSMEKSSRVLQHIYIYIYIYIYMYIETQKLDFFFKKVWNWILTCADELKSL